MRYFKNALFLLLFSCCGSCSCDPYKLNRKLHIRNNSNTEIVIIDSPSYPDTLNYSFEPCRAEDVARLVPPNSDKIYLHRINWENEIKKSSNGGLLFFAIDADSAKSYAEKYGCDTIEKRKDLILKRFAVTLDYLNSNNWTLTYP